jgi:magnesium-transporting ATPase (P-type)
VRTGDATYIGTIARAAGGARARESSMEREVKRVAAFIAVIALGTGVAAAAIGLAQGRGVAFSLTSGLLLTIVANVPEGLPTSVVVVLNLCARALLDARVLIKKPDLIEALGATTALLTDKTGTLTQNRMVVTDAWAALVFVPVAGDDSAAPPRAHAPARPPPWRRRHSRRSRRRAAAPTSAAMRRCCWPAAPAPAAARRRRRHPRPRRPRPPAARPRTA